MFDGTPNYSGALFLFGSATKGVAYMAWSELTDASSWAVGHDGRDCRFNPIFLGCQIGDIVLQFRFEFSYSSLGVSFACIAYLLPVWIHRFALPFFQGMGYRCTIYCLYHVPKLKGIRYCHHFRVFLLLRPFWRCLLWGSAPDWKCLGGCPCTLLVCTGIGPCVLWRTDSGQGL